MTRKLIYLNVESIILSIIILAVMMMAGLRVGMLFIVALYGGECAVIITFAHLVWKKGRMQWIPLILCWGYMIGIDWLLRPFAKLPDDNALGLIWLAEMLLFIIISLISAAIGRVTYDEEKESEKSYKLHAKGTIYKILHVLLESGVLALLSVCNVYLPSYIFPFSIWGGWIFVVALFGLECFFILFYIRRVWKKCWLQWGVPLASWLISKGLFQLTPLFLRPNGNAVLLEVIDICKVIFYLNILFWLWLVICTIIGRGLVQKATI